MQYPHSLLILSLSTLFFAGCTGASGSSASGQSASGSGPSTGNDMYYEYTITSAGKGISMNGSHKLYVSSGGGLRSEMDLSNPVTGKSSPIISIATEGKPNESILLDDSAKTYTVNNIDSLMADASAGPFKLSSTVSKAGEEKILGFNCIHARILSTRDMGPLGKLTDTVDLWNSPDVPLAPFLRHYMDKNFSRSWTAMMSPGSVAELQKMGCTGFMVKVHSVSGATGMNMELTKVQKGDFPKSMFEIPAGYKEDQQ